MRGRKSARSKTSHGSQFAACASQTGRLRRDTGSKLNQRVLQKAFEEGVKRDGTENGMGTVRTLGAAGSALARTTTDGRATRTPATRIAGRAERCIAGILRRVLVGTVGREEDGAGGPLEDGTVLGRVGDGRAGTK